VTAVHAVFPACEAAEDTAGSGVSSCVKFPGSSAQPESIAAATTAAAMHFIFFMLRLLFFYSKIDVFMSAVTLYLLFACVPTFKGRNIAAAVKEFFP
jgi:hypothetical protein